MLYKWANRFQFLETAEILFANSFHLSRVWSLKNNLCYIKFEALSALFSLSRSRRELPDSFSSLNLLYYVYLLVKLESWFCLYYIHLYTFSPLSHMHRLKIVLSAEIWCPLWTLHFCLKGCIYRCRGCHWRIYVELDIYLFSALIKTSNVVTFIEVLEVWNFRIQVWWGSWTLACNS